MGQPRCNRQVGGPIPEKPISTLFVNRRWIMDHGFDPLLPEKPLQLVALVGLYDKLVPYPLTEGIGDVGKFQRSVAKRANIGVGNFCSLLVPFLDVTESKT